MGTEMLSLFNAQFHVDRLAAAGCEAGESGRLIPAKKWSRLAALLIILMEPDAMPLKTRAPVKHSKTCKTVDHKEKEVVDEIRKYSASPVARDYHTAINDRWRPRFSVVYFTFLLKVSGAFRRSAID
jgi:hypothetical protein